MDGIQGEKKQLFRKTFLFDKLVCFNVLEEMHEHFIGLFT